MAFDYTPQMLADFTGRPVASFPPSVATSAIPQAVLLFKLGTCLSTLDGLSEEHRQLADFAILAMADQIQLSAPYAAALASPFNSESIGSYSYSKTAAAVRRGEDTGVMWFDMAMQTLSVCDTTDGDFMRGGIEVYEHDGVFTSGALSGNSSYLTPAEVDASRHYGYDPNRPMYKGLA